MSIYDENEIIRTMRRSDSPLLDSFSKTIKERDQLREERDQAREDLKATYERLRMAQMLLGRIAEKSTDLGEFLKLINEAHGQLPPI